MKRWIAWGLVAVIIALAAGASAAEPARTKGPGLTVGPGGVLLKDEKPYRGIGVNYFSAFARTLKDPGDKSYEAGLRILSENNIPFVRFMACGFWPADMKLYQENKAEYFRRLDLMVEAAQKCNVGLIPSLFWHVATVPDLVGETLDQWGNPASETHRFMREYTREVVTRYKDNPAIWGWEFGNEYNLKVDLPNAAEQRAPVVPALGTPAARSEKDDLTGEMIQTAFVEFARTVRVLDKRRIILTGNSQPRPSAWHQAHEKSWKADTSAQMAEMFAAENPDPINVMSVHIYFKDDELPSLQAYLEIARKLKKPLFAGEFGVPGESEKAKTHFNKLLALIQTDVPLAALWVYDFPTQEKGWNVTADNPRAYQLKAIGQANREIVAGKPPTVRANSATTKPAALKPISKKSIPRPAATSPAAAVPSP